MCCDVNRLNAKQSPSIITSSDVFMCLECACQITHDDYFLFSYVLFDCLYGRARIAPNGSLFNRLLYSVRNHEASVTAVVVG